MQKAPHQRKKSNMSTFVNIAIDINQSTFIESMDTISLIQNLKKILLLNFWNTAH